MTPRRRFALVALAAALAYLPAVRHRNLKDCGGSSRMATVESLVERGTFAIDGSTFAYTCDAMVVGGRLHSDKPPLLSVAAAGIYLVLHEAFGLRFNPEAHPERNQLHDHTYALMTALVAVAAQALLVALADRAAGEVGLAGGARLLVTASAAFATLLWPLTALFNPHNVAALLVLAGLRWGALAGAPRRPLAAGLALGAAAGVDLPLGLLALAGAVAIAPGGRLRMALGAAGPLAVHGALNVWIVGDLVPFQLHRELYTDATGHTGDSATGFDQAAGLAYYAWRNLFGSLGAFALTPLLGLCLWLAVARLVRRATGSRGAATEPGAAPGPRFTALAAGLFVAALVLYVAVWPQAVGCAYGMRHLAPVTLPLVVAAAPALAGRGVRRAWTALAAASAVMAGTGLVSPASCAGFVEDARGRVPARVFLVTLAEGVRRAAGTLR